MECMICFETRSPYHLKGCNHTICEVCAEQLKSVPSCIKHPFSNKITVVIPETINCLKCPYCRQDEPSSFNMDYLQKKYPDEYKLWMEAELKYNGSYTYLIVMDSVKIEHNRKIQYKPSIFYFHEGEIIDCIYEYLPIKFIMTRFRGGYSKRDQLKQYKQYKVYKNRKFLLDIKKNYYPVL